MIIDIHLLVWTMDIHRKVNSDLLRDLTTPQAQQQGSAQSFHVNMAFGAWGGSRGEALGFGGFGAVQKLGTLKPRKPVLETDS